MKGADRGPGHLCQLDWPHLGLIDGPARSICGEDRCAPGLDHPFQAEYPLATTARARSAHRIEAKQPQNASNQLAIETLANKNDGSGSAKIEGAGQNALMPEAVDLRARL